MARIAIDARLWTKTGVGRYIRNLTYSLAEDPNSQKHSFHILLLSEDKRKVGKLPNNFILVDCNFYWHSLQEQVGFANFLNKEKFDLVHFTYSPSPLFYKHPFVITVHDLIMVKNKTGKASTLPYPLYLAKHKIYKMLLGKSIKKSEKIIVPTKTIQDEIKKEYSVDGEKIVVTYEGFDKNIQNKTKQNMQFSGEKYFLYVGNAYPHKNVKTVLEAFTDFQRANRDFRLVLVGASDFFYDRLLSEYKENKSIIHLKSVSDHELSYLYEHSFGFVSASISEGFGLPVLESLLHATPVLLSDIPVFREIAEDLGVYFDQNDKEDLANRMEYVVKHFDTLHDKAKAKRKEMEARFSWSTLAQKTLTIYESCIGI